MQRINYFLQINKIKFLQNINALKTFLFVGFSLFNPLINLKLYWFTTLKLV